MFGREDNFFKEIEREERREFQQIEKIERQEFQQIDNIFNNNNGDYIQSHHNQHHKQHHQNQRRHSRSRNNEEAIISYEEQQLINARLQQQAAIDAEAMRQNELRLQEQAKITAEQNHQRLLQQQAESKRLAEQRLIEAIEIERYREEEARKEAIRKEERARENLILEQQLAIAREKALKEQQRLESQRRIEEQKHQELLKQQEEKIENNRETVFDEHVALISPAISMSFHELQKRINALNELTEPQANFKKSLKQGMPYSEEKNLFYTILKNAEIKIAAEKYQLISRLLQHGGYFPYINELFSSPSIELLMVTHHVQDILLPLYLYAKLDRGFVFDFKIERMIWSTLLSAGHEIELFKSFRDIGKIDTFIKLDSQGQTIWPNVFNLSQLAQSKIEFSLEIFMKWSAAMQPTEIVNFLNFYQTYISASLTNPAFKLDPQIWPRIFATGDYYANEFYNFLKNSKFPIATLMQFLTEWSAIYKWPHDYSLLANNYDALIKENHLRQLLECEPKIWETLIRCSNKIAETLFKSLVNHFSEEVKLMQFAECWLSSLDTDQQKKLAYKFMKPEISQSAIKEFKEDVRKLSQLGIAELVASNAPITDNAGNQKWLKNSRPLFWSCRCSSNAKPAYDIYNMLREKKTGGDKALQEAQQETEEKINEKLNQLNAGQGHFQLRKK